MRPALALATVLLAGPVVACRGGRPITRPSDAGPAPMARWSAAPPMLHARSAHAVVATDAAIYAIAGTGAGHAPVLDVERFDGTRWSSETTLPGAGLNAPAAVVLRSRIYVIGGFSAVTNVPTSDVHVYDPRTRMWGTAAPLPAPRGGHAAVVLDGRIHVFGGGNSRSTIADHSVYDPAADRWTGAAPLPRAEGSPAGAVLDGRIYAIGGRSGPNDFGDVYVYDERSNQWTAGPGIEPRGTSGAAVFRGTIYLVGGESQARDTVLSDLLRLDRAAGRWERVAAPLPTARGYARAVTFGDALYVIGGTPVAGSSHDAAGSPVVERFTLPRP